MSNSKISALTASTTPLAGTETLPIVQSSTTKQVSVANLTAGRAVSASSLTASSGGVSVKGGPTGYGGDEIAMQTTSATYSAISTQMTGQSVLYFDHRGTSNQGSFIWRNGSGGANTLASLGGTTNDFTLNSGNVVIGTSGKGIDFSATPGTGTSELLADYEDGTWTPAYSSTGATFGYTQQFGSYVKIGQLVYAQFYLNVTASGTTTNQVTISGLPFTSTSVNTPYEQGFGGAWSTNIQAIAFTINPGATTVTLWKQNIGAAVAIALNVVGYQVGTLIYRSAT